MLFILFNSIFIAYSNTELSMFNMDKGILVAGYANNGAFINFTGPNISIEQKN